MKWSLFFSMLAMTLYASEIVTTDLKLSKINPWSMTFLYGLGTALIALPFVLGSPDLVEMKTWPTKAAEWGFVILICVFAAGAAWAHFSALNHHSGAVILCTFYMLLPVVAAGLMAILGHGLPTWRLVVAWILAGAALYLAGSHLTGST